MKNLDKWTGFKEKIPKGLFELINTEDYELFGQFLVKSELGQPLTEIEQLITVCKNSGRTTVDKKIKNKLKEVFEKDIELRLLNEEEFNAKNKLF